MSSIRPWPRMAPPTARAPQADAMRHELSGLPRADGIVFADAHPGEPVQIMRGLNPSIVDEGTAARCDRGLDPSIRRTATIRTALRTIRRVPDPYFAAQAKRMSDLIDYAQDG